MCRSICLMGWAGLILFPFLSWAAGSRQDTTELERRAADFYENRQYDSAQKTFERAFAQLLTAKDTAGIIRSAVGRSNALLRQRDYDQALAALTHEIPFKPEQVQNEYLRSQLYNEISNVYYYKYDAFSALENYRHYYSYLKKHSPGSAELMQASRVMTIYTLNAGLLTAALQYAAEFKNLALMVEGEISEASADASNFLGMLSRYTGEPRVALLHYKQALDIASALNEKGAHLPSNILQSNIGMLYMNELQDPDMALEYFRQSKMFLLADGSNPYDLGQIEGKFALYYADKGHYDSAHACLDRNLELLRQADRTEMEIYGKLALKAQFFYDQGDFTKSLQQLDEATRFRYRSMPGNIDSNWATDYHKGRVWLALERPDSALYYFQRALVSYLPDAKPGEDSVPEYTDLSPEKLMITKILHGKARAYQALTSQGREDKSKQAFEHYRGLLDWLYQIRSSFVYGESKVYISGNMQEIIDEAIALAFEQYKQTGDRRFLSFIHHTIETNKWVTLKEELLTSQARIPGSFELAGQLDFLVKRVAFMNQQLAENNYPAEDSVALVARRLDLEKEILRIRKDQNWLAESTTMQLDQVQLYLEPGEVLSEFLLGNSRLHQLLITKDSVLYLAHEQPGKREEEVNQLRASIRNGQAATYNQLAFNLNQRYVSPAFALLRSGLTRQIVIPDAFMNNLPFDALLTIPAETKDQFPRTGYLLEKVNTRKHFTVAGLNPNTAHEIGESHVVAYSPNFTQENIKKVYERAAESLVNLPYAIEECQSLTKLFGGDFYQGTAATETSFKHASGQASIIHLATHAVMEDGLPDRSRLLLFADSLNDGLLHSYEINALDIRSELVALSACNTGIGEYRTGEGNMSLARGFYLAGTKSVLMSLWTVDDHSTASLMTGFYSYLEQGLSKDEALQKAKLDMLRNADNIHRNPYYWAGFDMVGDGSPVVKKGHYWLPWTLACGLIVLAGLWWHRRGRR